MREFAAKVKRYYELGLWTEQRIRDAVAKNAITPEEFKAITGKGLLGD
ncbi:MAG: XkdX family protein [Synergistaceae bacterium]|nr:XkdX family protein [Synergistaceae bacterium]